jgi:hypothetical protein
MMTISDIFDALAAFDRPYKKAVPREKALALADASLFEPLYGPGSAERFLALAARAVTVEHPNLAHDVDTLEDLRRYELRTGPRTQMALAMAGLARVA